AAPHHATPEARAEEALPLAEVVDELHVPADPHIVRVFRPLLVVPHPFRTRLRVVLVDERERGAGHVADDVAAVRAQTYLTRVLFGRLFVWPRPLVLSILGDRHRYAVLQHVALCRVQYLGVLLG